MIQDQIFQAGIGHCICEKIEPGAVQGTATGNRRRIRYWDKATIINERRDMNLYIYLLKITSDTHDFLTLIRNPIDD